MHGAEIALHFECSSIENRRLLMACLDRRKAILGTIAATLTGLATAAMAQPMMGPGSGRGPGIMGGGPGMMGGFGNTESYLASLKVELGISANQEAAW
jgi:hypothetical protein